jgi:hypothetical protein
MYSNSCICIVSSKICNRNVGYNLARFDSVTNFRCDESGTKDINGSIRIPFPHKKTVQNPPYFIVHLLFFYFITRLSSFSGQVYQLRSDLDNSVPR